MRGLHTAVMTLVGVLLVAAASAVEDREGLGYPEPVIHWLVEPGETCVDVALTLYESARHVDLIERYNDVDCRQPLAVSRLLVLPMKVTALPVARLGDARPVVRARPPEGAWVVANTGMTFAEGYGVNTLQRASAELLFRDNSRILLQENTLVVIYDGASRSASQLQSRQAHVAVEDGELRAAMDSLHGGPVQISTPEGGEVQARSREMTVRRNLGRTAVSVFEGEASITSAAEVVEVPSKYGTTFFDHAPPWRPRPLPLAPEWLGGSERVVTVNYLQVGPNHRSGTVTVSWNALEEVTSYRIELAQDQTFRQVSFRQEVPHIVRTLRLSNLPAGAYYVRVQGVDRDGLLGLPSVPRALWVLGVVGDVTEIGERTFARSVYSPVRLISGDGLAVSVDESAVLDDGILTSNPVAPNSTVTWSGHHDAQVSTSLNAERPMVQLQARWLSGALPRIRLHAVVSGRSWPSGDVRYGGLTANMWREADFHWTLSQRGSEARIWPRRYTPQGWTADVEVPTREPVTIAWRDAWGVQLATVTLRERLAPQPQTHLESWRPSNLWLPGSALPAIGLGVPTAMIGGLRAGTDGLAHGGFVGASGRLSSTWSVAAEWTSSINGWLTSGDTGGVGVYAATAINRWWRLGVRGGARLPFALDSSRVLAATGVGVEGEWHQLRLLSGVEARIPVGHGRPQQSTVTSYHLGASWAGERVPVRCYVLLEGLQRWDRAPGRLHVGTYWGAEVGTEWVGGVAARLSPSSNLGHQLAFQTTLTHPF